MQGGLLVSRVNKQTKGNRFVGAQSAGYFLCARFYVSKTCMDIDVSESTAVLRHVEAAFHTGH